MVHAGVETRNDHPRTIRIVNAKVTLEQLEEIATQIGIDIRYEPLQIEGTIHTGGYCRVMGKPVVILNKKAAKSEQIKVLLDALRRHDLTVIYLRPSIRKLIEQGKEA